MAPVEEGLEGGEGAEELGVLEEGVEGREGEELQTLGEGLDVRVGGHVDEVEEEVEDGLDHDETFYSVFIHRVIDSLGLHVEDIREPIEDTKDDSPPNEELTEKGHFLKVIRIS